MLLSITTVYGLIILALEMAGVIESETNALLAVLVQAWAANFPKLPGFGEPSMRSTATDNPVSFITYPFQVYQVRFVCERNASVRALLC